MSKPDIAQIVKKGTPRFSYFRHGVLYYDIDVYEDEGRKVYRFPVPAESLDGATVRKTEKGLTLMRWIRKAIEDGTFVPAE